MVNKIVDQNANTAHTSFPAAKQNVSKTLGDLDATT